jgi:hypothetical protein
MAAKRRATNHPPGDAWLAECSGHERLVHEVWSVGGLAPIHCTQWLAAEAQLATALEARKRIPAKARGPLLLDSGLDAAWWLVPLDAADELADIRPLTVHPYDWPLHCPSPQRPAGGRFWLDAPDGSGKVTDPACLAAAFGPAVSALRAEAFG